MIEHRAGGQSIMRAGRPRIIRERNAKGKLRPIKREQREDNPHARLKRQEKFGVTERQSKNPLSGCLAGVLYLRGEITMDHLKRFFSYLQLTPDFGSRAILVRERVQG